MAAKRDEVTIREVYELLDRIRREWDERENIREREARAERQEFDKKIADLYIEIYGEGETRGLKSRIGANELDLLSIHTSRKTDAWKQLLTTLVASMTAAIASATWHTK